MRRIFISLFSDPMGDPVKVLFKATQVRLVVLLVFVGWMLLRVIRNAANNLLSPSLISLAYLL